MKSNSKTAVAGTKTNNNNRTTATDKKTTVRNAATSSATEKVRSKHQHGHGMHNEGTAVDYEEQR